MQCCGDVLEIKRVRFNKLYPFQYYNDKAYVFMKIKQALPPNLNLVGFHVHVNHDEQVFVSKKKTTLPWIVGE